MNETHKLNSEAILPFMLAGKALLTISNTKSGNRNTYRIQAPGHRAEDRQNSKILFVSVLSGPDNGGHSPFDSGYYTYIGVVDRKNQQFHLTKKSKLSSDDPRVAGFCWLLYQLQNNTLEKFPHVEVRHHNHCGACGRTLTVPESIDSGLGPICAARF